MRFARPTTGPELYAWYRAGRLTHDEMSVDERRLVHMEVLAEALGELALQEPFDEEPQCLNKEAPRTRVA